eukprot:scpid71710/ scgid13386/ 
MALLHVGLALVCLGMAVTHASPTIVGMDAVQSLPHDQQQQQQQHHHSISKRSLDQTSLRRVMTPIGHFEEVCTANCTAANQSVAAGGQVCSLEPRRVVALGHTHGNHDPIHASTILSADEKSFYFQESTRFGAQYFHTPVGDQFTEEDHVSYFYDPTRFPPIYSHWHCQKTSTGLHSSCRLPAVDGHSSPIQYGVCRHVCDKRLVMRRVKKTSSCTVPSASPLVGSSTYVWAFCVEPLKTGLVCVPPDTSEIDISCLATVPVQYYCNPFQSFASSK